MTPGAIARFWAKVDRAGECWLWTAYVNNRGYGHFNVGAGKLMRAHRVSWVLSHGDIPETAHVCHRCDNRKCVNPAHLFLGTHKENMADMVAKDRHNKGVRNPMAKVTPGVVASIREGRARGERLDALASRFGVAQTTVCAIAKGRSWSWV